MQPDLGLVDALARLKLAARRLGCSMRVCEPSVELAELMIKVSGSSSRVTLVPKEAVYDRGYEDIPRRVPSVTRMHALLGVTAEVPLEEGLARTIEWFKRQ